MRDIHVVGAAIMNGCSVLAAKRSKFMYPPFKWEFAGGKVEEGESHQQALEREIMEELGVSIRVKDFVADGISEEDDIKIFLHVYEAEILSGNPLPKEHSELVWVEIDRLGEYDWADPDIPACKELIRRYGGVCWNYRNS